MSLAPRLDLRQSQSLVMTPQLQQAIKLLALSNLEIETFIAEELEKNPLLEATPGDGERDAAPEPDFDAAAEADFAADHDEAPAPADASDLLTGTAAAADEAALDVDFTAETFHHDSAADSIGGLDGGLGMAGTGGGGSEDGPDFENFGSADISLADHLMAQAGTSVDGADLFIAAHMIDQIDETGYLTVPLLEIANRLNVPLARVEQVLGVIQTFDPTGVGARSLSECLALQAKEADRYDPCMARLLDNLDLLARGELARLKRICGVDDEDLADMIRELRAYDPKPGCRYGGEPVPAIVPDIFVARRGNGWAVEINAATLPRLLVNRAYYVELSTGRQDKGGKAWLSDMLASANWLVKALDQRQRTIIKVASEIVKQQEAFFLHGVAHLKPMTLRQVAEAIEMHESTVSRVTSNKYLSCARGVFELKYFFTSAIQSSEGGDAVSAQAVKSAIRTLIQAEDPKAILSDDTLVELLNAKGFDIARRTVAKYRESMGIGSSVQRRRQKALEGVG
ncbi:RNA polymerase factor sigma-54 [Sphingomonas canadensis]|uniref:RNA polymerase sigma-54 factor n=1 Tax=Sphingomonas canadensis TaxID=1219257 RepID=A0ABW3H236_9SPHN|nr:RNA polymerase factor sigma-54 [Sphingomonas canadensis]MCW3835163.1 RNA polymerase factor sigma-54 [Sphingomonas canadensis]